MATAVTMERIVACGVEDWWPQHGGLVAMVWSVVPCVLVFTLQRELGLTEGDNLGCPNLRHQLG